jgi:hypothetical protein
VVGIRLRRLDRPVHPRPTDVLELADLEVQLPHARDVQEGERPRLALIHHVATEPRERVRPGRPGVNDGRGAARKMVGIVVDGEFRHTRPDVDVEVDEARGDKEARRVDHARGVGGQRWTDRRDSIALDRDVRSRRRARDRVNHASAPDQHVVPSALPRRNDETPGLGSQAGSVGDHRRMSGSRRRARRT